MSTLYIVATPIGNLSDVTARAVEVLQKVPLIIAEDTRHTQRLLAGREVTARLVSFHARSTEARTTQIVQMLQNSDAALVTDAGTPAISDPGGRLIRAARAAGHVITPVPGPSALTAALSVSGFDLSQFTFIGFMPRTAGKVKKLLAEHLARGTTFAAFETPHRIAKTLTVLAELAPTRALCVCRELTKLHEETFHGTPAEALAHFKSPRGEFTLIVSRPPKDSD